MIQPLPIAKAAEEVCLLPGLANRHGLIAGATGTGKTVTLQRMAEAFSRIGVPVFMADVKGDLSGMSQAGQLSPKLEQRLKELLARRFMDHLERDVLAADELSSLVERVASRALDPYTAADELLTRAVGHRPVRARDTAAP